eukprot:210128_1
MAADHEQNGDSKLESQLILPELDLANLDITTEEIDLRDVDDDLQKFQQDDIVKEALLKGVDLRQYSQQIEQQLEGVQNDSISDYLKESENLARLHKQIQGCDGILENMQKMLSGFQNNLKSISGEIKHLQDESLSMNVQLNNRKAAEDRLSNFVSSIVVHPDLIRDICDAAITEHYIENLVTLNSKLHFLREGTSFRSRASEDLRPTLDELKMKAISRIREFLLKRIHSLKKPKTNIQIKQDLMLKFKYFYEFLSEHAPEVAHEISNSYVDTMGKMYYGHFRIYLTNMNKLKSTNTIDKNDVLAATESVSAGLFAAKKSLNHLTDVFHIRNRHIVLKEIEKDPIVYHVAAKSSQLFPYGSIFRSTTRLLMDTATSEFAFLVQFFSKRNMFVEIFAKTLSFFLEQLENYLFGCFDCLGLLIMVRITYLHQLVMNDRHTPCLDAFFDRINMLLWPRFKIVLDMNLNSVRDFILPRGIYRELNEFYLIPRYANLVSGIHLLNKHYNDDIITNHLLRLQKEIERLLLRVASLIETDQQQVIFLINNYHCIVATVQSFGVESSAEVQFFTELRTVQVQKYVEEALNDRFGSLVRFVSHTERQEKRLPEYEIDFNAAEQVARSFNSTWRASVTTMHSIIERHFCDPKHLVGQTDAPPRQSNYREVFQKVLTELLLYYQRFLGIAKKLPSDQYGLISKDLVTTQTISYTIRKFFNPS